MKTRGVIGQRIVAVNQKMIYNDSVKQMVNIVYSITLENGVELWTRAEEYPYEPIGTLDRLDPQKPKKGGAA